MTEKIQAMNTEFKAAQQRIHKTRNHSQAIKLMKSFFFTSFLIPADQTNSHNQTVSFGSRKKHFSTERAQHKPDVSHSSIHLSFFLFLFVAVLFCSAAPVGAQVIYVDADAVDGGDGTSWTSAYNDLQDALDEAESGDQVWVAEGVYTPVTPTDPNNVTDTERQATFQLVDNVEIYGGFAGGEGSLDDRDWTANLTILSGDIDGNDDEEIIGDPETEISGDNSYHVVIGPGLGDTARLDGFTITAGLANASVGRDLLGAGMFNLGNPVLANLVFAGNRAGDSGSGGGMFNDGEPTLMNVTFTGNSAGSTGGGMANTDSSPTLTNVMFAGNNAGFEGGGMFNHRDSSPTLTNVTFAGNSGGYGGGMANSDESSPTLTNVILNDNSADNWGGGMYNIDSSPTLINVTLSGNSAGSDGGGIYNLSDLSNSSPTLINSIVWGNMTDGSGNEIYNDSNSSIILDYSLYRDRDEEDDIVEGGGFAANNSPTKDPVFVDSDTPAGPDGIFGTDDDGLHLANGSPAINAGTNDPYDNGEPADGVTTDLAGNDRIRYTTVDMGAYEWEWTGGSTVFVDKNATGNNTGESWEEAFNHLQDGLFTARTANSEIDQIWVAEGVYTPVTPADPNNVTDTERQATFQLVDNVEIYGGFAGGEGSLGDRDWAANPTILSGDIDDNDDPFEPDDDSDGNPGTPSQTDHINGNNSYHVVTGPGPSDTARLDGFTITGGVADGGDLDNSGAGLFNLGNSGASEGSSAFVNLVFAGNRADGDGGGMYNDETSPILTNVTFAGNSSENGGGMFNKAGSSPILTNVTLSGNNAGSGGGMYSLSSSSPTLTNSIVWGNTADADGNEIYNGSNASIILDYSLYRDRDGENDIVEGDGFTADNSLINVDPVFTDPGNGDFTLQNISPAMNAGDPATDLSLFPGGPSNPLDLAGNPRVFDGDTDIIDIGAYEFQGNPFSPEADNGRVLASSLNGYVFVPADFGQSDTDASVIVKTLPSNGDLELDGSVVTADDEIPVGDIDDGKLTYMPTAGDHGADYDSFNFTVKESGIESDPFTMTIDVGTASLELTGTEGTSGEGWRFLGNPSDGDSYGDLLGPIWTKGVPGSDSPGALLPNIYTLNQADYQWEAPSNLSSTTSPGQPFIVYVYSDDNNNGTPEGFPKMLISGDNWQPLDGAFSYGGLGYDESAENPDNHYLIANPHPVSLDFCEFTSTNAANSIDIWDPSANGGNGDYENLSCGVDDVFIAPFQGFWVRTTDSNPVLEIPEAAYLESAEEGYFKQPSKGSKPLEGLALAFTVQSEDNIFTNTARILFSEEASVGLDEWDAPKLNSAGLASRWLSFYSLDEQEKAYALQNLPIDFGEKISIPLDIQTTEAGSYTMEWSLPESQGFGGSYFLRDNRTGEVIELREGAEYRFEIALEQTSKVSETLEVLGEAISQRSDDSEARFELLIASSGVDGFTELGAVPEDFTLAQNYPNPFNPTTVIRYQLPVNSEVRLEVYDMLGRRVAQLVNGQVAAGRHTVNFDASGLSSGIYLYRLAAGSTIMTKKLTVVK